MSTAWSGPRLSPSWGPLPWQPGELLALLFGLLVGAVAVLLSWVGASGTLVYSHQLTFIAVGIGGVIVSGLGTCVWLLAGFRSVRERQRVLASELGSRVAAPERGLHPAESVHLVTAAGMLHAHRSSCQLVRGKTVSPVTGNLQPACGMCQP